MYNTMIAYLYILTLTVSKLHNDTS